MKYTDKILEKDLKEGQYVFVIYNDFTCIVKVDQYGRCQGKGLMMRNNGELKIYGYNIWSGRKGIERLATAEEISWFERSHAAGKILPREPQIINEYSIY